MLKAWIENGVVREAYADPYAVHHPQFAVLFDTDVPDGTLPGATLVDGVWVNPAPVAPEAPKLSPVQFKMCFTSQERIAIKALRATNPVIDDAYDILDDPRLTMVDLSLASNQEMIDCLVSLSVLTTARAAQIKAGVML